MTSQLGSAGDVTSDMLGWRHICLCLNQLSTSVQSNTLYIIQKVENYHWKILLYMFHGQPAAVSPAVDGDRSNNRNIHFFLQYLQ